jgi:hypothetical protein
VARVAHTRLTVVQDKFIWSLLQNSSFTVKSIYNALIIDTRVRQNVVLWTMKVPLRIKFFMCNLKRGVMLTKDNLARRNWSGSKLCVFCSHLELIQHLFFDGHFSKFLWRTVQVTFNIGVPMSIAHIFYGWVDGLGSQFKLLVLVAMAALCWTLWISRNDIVFDNLPIKTYM